MSKIPDSVIAEWATKKKHINDRLNRIKKRLKKYERQKAHFELRIRLIQKFEKESKINSIVDICSNGEHNDRQRKGEGS